MKTMLLTIGLLTLVPAVRNYTPVPVQQRCVTTCTPSSCDQPINGRSGMCTPRTCTTTCY